MIINQKKLLFTDSTAAATGRTNLVDTIGSENASLSLSGGISVGNAIVVRSGSTGVATLAGTDTGAINTFSGAITLNKGLTLQSAAGGTLAVSSVINDATGSFAVT